MENIIKNQLVKTSICYIPLKVLFDRKELVNELYVYIWRRSM